MLLVLIYARAYLLYNRYMEPAPVSSFVRFVVGFLTFIGVSFGVTIGVNAYAGVQDSQQMAAAALSAMLELK